RRKSERTRTNRLATKLIARGFGSGRRDWRRIAEGQANPHRHERLGEVVGDGDCIDGLGALQWPKEEGTGRGIVGIEMTGDRPSHGFGIAGRAIVEGYPWLELESQRPVL